MKTLLKKTLKKALVVLSCMLVACSMALAMVPTKAQAADTIKVYRLYNPYSGEHLYTYSWYECFNSLIAGWNYEGIAWYAPSYSNMPVYRLYNPYSGDHHYTKDKGEYDSLGSIGWRQEGIGFYSDDAETVPLYRLYNKYLTAGTHHYTTSRNEYDELGSIGWSQENIGWYGVAAGVGVDKDTIVNAAINNAKSLIGTPYNTVVDGTALTCNGLTYYAYSKAGFEFMPQWSGKNHTFGQFQYIKNSNRWRTRVADLKPGDLVFYSKDGGKTVYHVAMYLGNNQVIHSVQEGDTVRITRLSYVRGFCGGGSVL